MREGGNPHSPFKGIHIYIYICICRALLPRFPTKNLGFFMGMGLIRLERKRLNYQRTQGRGPSFRTTLPFEGLTAGQNLETQSFHSSTLNLKTPNLQP